MVEQPARPSADEVRRLLADYRWPEASLARLAGFVPSSLWRKLRGEQPYAPADAERIAVVLRRLATDILTILTPPV